MTESLSTDQARKLALHSQEVLAPRRAGRAIDATLASVEHLGYVQIDTISVVERAHHHTLWVRNPRYRPGHLDQLLADRKVYEYWSHAAAYLPMRDFRYSLPNMEEIRRGRKHWYECDPDIKDRVFQRVREEGPLQARDFEDQKNRNLGMWEWKPAKIALEQLFMEGRLMVTRREGFQKVYDLRERVLPDEADTRIPTRDEMSRFLITSFLRAHGLGTAAEIGYLRRGMRDALLQALDEMEEDGQIQPVLVGAERYHVEPCSLDLLDRPISRSRARIVSPFDNLVIQRGRMQKLFDFDYQIECYVPEKKRKHGYFCLPIIWNGRLCARMDCKADRKTSTLLVRYLALEPWLRRKQDFSAALARELSSFMDFNQCEGMDIGERCDPVVAEVLRARLL